MSFAHRLLDVIVAGVVASASTFLLALVVTDQQFTSSVGIVLASMYYFSRNPWGSSYERGRSYNERIDAAYDRVLP